MERKKILFLLQRFPYPHTKGDQLSAYNHLKYLSQYHDVYLYCTSDVEITDAYLKKVDFLKDVQVIELTKLGILWRLFKAMWTWKPFQVAYFHGAYNEALIKNYVEVIQPDTVYCQFLRMAPYVNALEIPKKVLDYEDALSKILRERLQKTNLFFKPIIYWEYVKMRRFERTVFDWFDTQLIISERDKQEIQHPLNQKIEVVANGVDVDLYDYDTTTEKTYDLIFAGNMNYPPNVDCCLYLAQEIMPILWQKYPHLKLVLAGAEPHKEVQNLANDNIIVTGWVEDMRWYYRRSKILIAPMRMGAGLQNKLLEGLSMGLPTITSTMCNASLMAQPQKHILIADTPQEVATAVCELLEQPTLYKNLQEQGRAFIMKHYTWDAQNEKLMGYLV